MKNELPEFIQKLNKSKVPLVAIDQSLGKYRDNTPFPKKLEIAKEMLKTAKLPERKHRS